MSRWGSLLGFPVSRGLSPKRLLLFGSWRGFVGRVRLAFLKQVMFGLYLWIEWVRLEHCFQALAHPRADEETTSTERRILYIIDVNPVTV